MVNFAVAARQGGIMSKKQVSKVVPEGENTPAPVRRRVEFVIEAGPGKNVSVAGSFNDWDPAAKVLSDRKGDGVYRGCLMLLPGEYEYKFVVDGNWQIDANNPCFASNDLGTLNSVLKVEIRD